MQEIRCASPGAEPDQLQTVRRVVLACMAAKKRPSSSEGSSPATDDPRSIAHPAEDAPAPTGKTSASPDETAPLGPVPPVCEPATEQAARLEANPFPALSIPGKAIAAAYDLKREGHPVTVNATAKRAGIDRSHLTKRYPEAVRLIKALGTPDGWVRDGSKDRQTGSIEVIDDDEG